MHCQKSCCSSDYSSLQAEGSPPPPTSPLLHSFSLCWSCSSRSRHEAPPFPQQRQLPGGLFTLSEPWLSFLFQDFDNIKTFVEEELQTSMVSFTPTTEPWRQELLYPNLTCSPLSPAPHPPNKMVGMVIGAGIAIVLIAILIFFILRRIQLRSQ